MGVSILLMERLERCIDYYKTRNSNPLAKKGFRLFWQYKFRKRRPGRSPVDPEICKVIENMAKENLLWGAPRIHGELMKLGIDNI